MADSHGRDESPGSLPTQLNSHEPADSSSQSAMDSAGEAETKSGSGLANSGGPSSGEPRRRSRYSPANFRSQNHDSAHAQTHGQTGPRVDHPLVTHAEPIFINQQSDLLDLLTHLRAAGRFAYDSEFIGELTYIPKLCLIQVATSERVGLIDPLAGVDLMPFWELLADPTVEKIVHAGQQDIEPIFRNSGKTAANLFDTQICAGFTGMAYPTALSKLVSELVGVKLGKGLTFTHWDQRPLSAMQLKYAADDVRYLVAIHDILLQKMNQLGHTQWARSECETLCDPTQYGFNPHSHYLRIRGANTLPAKQQSVLRAISIWRDQRARLENVPPRAFLRDEVMLDLARNPVKSADKFARVRGLPRPVEHDHGHEIIEITAAALIAPVTDLPPQKDYEPTPQQRFRSDSLFAAFLCLCAGQSIDPALVASRQEVGDFFRAYSADETVDNHPLLTGWRKQAVGQSLLDLLAGKLQPLLKWDQNLITVMQPTP